MCFHNLVNPTSVHVLQDIGTSSCRQFLMVMCKSLFCFYKMLQFVTTLRKYVTSVKDIYLYKVEMFGEDLIIFT